MSAPTDNGRRADEGLHIPEFDLCDRLRKSLRSADLSVADMAEWLGLTRETASRYMNGSRVPLQTLRLWAMRTNVPLEWLQHGIVPANLAQSAEKPLPAVSGKRRTLDYRSAKLTGQPRVGHCGRARDITTDSGDDGDAGLSRPQGM